MVADCGSGSVGHEDGSAVAPMELISLHVPKAFGTSLSEVLTRHYGGHRVLGDYGSSLETCTGDRRMCRPVIAPSTTVIHGHFPAVRYAGMPARRRIAFLRDPVARTISHFFFWQVEPRHGNALHERVLDERLGLLEFAKLPEIRRFYSDTVFGGCDMVSFDLVGIVEDLERDWPRFQRVTGIRAVLPHLNRNRYPGYGEIAARVMADQALMRELRRILAEDIQFYARFL